MVSKSRKKIWVPRRQSRKKAKKLKEFLKQRLGVVGKQVWIDYRVLFTGSADPRQLTPEERKRVWTVDQALSITESSDRKRLLQTRDRGLLKLNILESQFDRLIRELVGVPTSAQ